MSSAGVGSTALPGQHVAGGHALLQAWGAQASKPVLHPAYRKGFLMWAQPCHGIAMALAAS